MKYDRYAVVCTYVSGAPAAAVNDDAHTARAVAADDRANESIGVDGVCITPCHVTPRTGVRRGAGFRRVC